MGQLQSNPLSHPPSPPEPLKLVPLVHKLEPPLSKSSIYPLIHTLDARGFLRTAISEARSGEERENIEDVRKPLVTHDS